MYVCRGYSDGEFTYSFLRQDYLGETIKHFYFIFKSSTEFKYLPRYIEGVQNFTKKNGITIDYLPCT